MGHEMPTHGRSTHIDMFTQTCDALQVASAHVGGKHWPLTHTFPPWHVTPAQVTSTQAPLRQTKPAPHVTLPQSRVWQRPSTQVSFDAHDTPTQAFCWHTLEFAHTWSVAHWAALQFFGRHWPPPHPSVAPHRFPHVPQFASSTSGLTQLGPHWTVPVPQTTEAPASTGKRLIDSAQPSATTAAASGTRSRFISLLPRRGR
jgi:hypothetical protein